MNFVDKLEEQVKEEIIRLTNYKEIDWDTVFLNMGEIDFHDHELEVFFWVGSYGTRYKFMYDYESDVGGLFSIAENDKYTTLWSVGSYPGVEFEGE